MKDTRHISGLMVSLLASLFPALSTADELNTVYNQPIAETAHTVQVHLDEGAAVFRVRRSFTNKGKKIDAAHLYIHLTDGAAATGMRVHDGERWRAAQLMDAERADTLYRELLDGPLPHAARPPALLSWESEDSLILEIYPVEAGQTRTIEYTLTAPTLYTGGQYTATYNRPSKDDKDLIAPTFTLLPLKEGGALSADGQVHNANQPWKAPLGSDDAIAIAFAPPTGPIEARLGRVAADRGEHILRLEIEAASELGRIPRDLRLVFLLDASHSMEDEGVEAQIQLFRAALSHAPAATFEIVVFRRFAEPLVGSFASASRFDAIIADARKKGRLVTGNGSALDEGIEAAIDALSGLSGAHYIIASTDGTMRNAWHNRLAHRPLLKAKTKPLVHLTIPFISSEEPELERADSHSLAPIAQRTGGVLYNLSGLDAPDKSILRAETEELLRPLRIDRLTISDDALPHDLPEVLDEGEGVRSMEITKGAPTQLTVSGLLWSRPIQTHIHVSEAFSRHTAAFTFGEGYHSDLSESAMTRVARFGRVVSPMTSYVALDRGLRPVPLMGRGFGLSGLGMRGSGSTRCGIGGARTRPQDDLRKLIQSEVQACISTHKPAAGWRVNLIIDSHTHEIVDVLHDPSPDAFETCLIDAAWTIDLPSSYRTFHRLTTSLNLP